MLPKFQIQDLQFTHFVVASLEKIIFACAREGQRVRNFLISYEGGWVKYQSNGHFTYLPGKIASDVLQRAQEFYGRVPVYRTETLSI